MLLSVAIMTCSSISRCSGYGGYTSLWQGTVLQCNA